MKLRHSLLFGLRTILTDLAHKPHVIETKWHDRLEYIAYKIVDPLIWK